LQGAQRGGHSRKLITLAQNEIRICVLRAYSRRSEPRQQPAPQPSQPCSALPPPNPAAPQPEQEGGDEDHGARTGGYGLPRIIAISRGVSLSQAVVGHPARGLGRVEQRVGRVSFGWLLAAFGLRLCLRGIRRSSAQRRSSSRRNHRPIMSARWPPIDSDERLHPAPGRPQPSLCIRRRRSLGGPRLRRDEFAPVCSAAPTRRPKDPCRVARVTRAQGPIHRRNLYRRQQRRRRHRASMREKCR
jgi:hypothetical protein